jgi:hypothetical protein
LRRGARCRAEQRRFCLRRAAALQSTPISGTLVQTD